MIRTRHKAAVAVMLLVAASACSGPLGESHGGAVANDPVAFADGGTDGSSESAANANADPWMIGPTLGARRWANGDVEVRVRAPQATRLELCLFAESFGVAESLHVPMDRAPNSDIFTIRVEAAQLRAAGVDAASTEAREPQKPIFYGLRAFGPNWTYDPSFKPGSLAGFVHDVDQDGHRMNPNKLLLDPYALEVSHDPINAQNGDGSVFRSGADKRQLDSALLAPKGVIFPASSTATYFRHADTKAQPTRPLRDDSVYEVHVRGFTKADASLPESERGTYAGAAKRAKYLHDLGVTTIELLPLHETPNDQNDRTQDAQGDNYWGYSTLSFFAPDRRYASDRSAGGPTRELRAMIEAFHAEGIKVWVDVVFNHTAEGGANGDAATIYSFRGLDNAAYYELAEDASRYVSGNGVGPNFNAASPMGSDLVVHSLRYWHEVLGVDGFRFDLAPIVGNKCTRACYAFDRAGLITRIAAELPARPADGGNGVDLIAEPWGLANGSYQVGGFPAGWSEWNDKFRDTIRRSLNRLGVDAVTPRDLAHRLSGSPDVYSGSKRPPASSINFVVAHDGMTLADVFTYDAKQNGQPWPFGPSGGGTDSDFAFSHGGDPARQHAATRTAFAIAALSAGVPMFTGGDERLRSQHGNNNAYNLDSPGTWIDWQPNAASDAFTLFAQRVLAFRNAHRALRPSEHWKQDSQVKWIQGDGTVANAAYLDGSDRHYIGMLLDGASLGDDARALFIAFSTWSDALTITLPGAPAGTTWSLAGDTSSEAEAAGAGAQSWRPIGQESPVTKPTYVLGRRGVAAFLAR